jgi:hypothetical protein
MEIKGEWQFCEDGVVRLLDLFALIVDRPGNLVCLLSQRHGYEIIQD